MQKKNDNLLDKFVKKNYNNELEKVLEKKYFDENTKSLLLSMMYKIEVAYKDYEKVKQNVEPKEIFIQKIIDIIQTKCDTIKAVKLNSEESEMLGNRTFLVDKKQKRIICYPIERKLLYCIAKIDKHDTIIKDKYYLINETLSELINVGNNINMVEPMRDFNGYSWTTIPREIESIPHNLIYQNLRMLVGYQFLCEWIENKEFIIDYMEMFKETLVKIYNEENADKIIKLLEEISILLAIRFNPKIKDKIKKEKLEIEEKLYEVQDNQKFIQVKTNEKRKIAEEIKNIDEILNNKDLLQKEYEKRNENLPLEKKIFSSRVLSQIMAKEREEKIEKIERINKILKPQDFVEYKNRLEEKEKYLKYLDIENIEKEIEKSLIKFQEEFIKCFKIKVEKAQTKQEIVKLIYELRYYNLLPYTDQKNICQIREIQKQLDELKNLLLKKAYKMKVTEQFAKRDEIHYELLKNIFDIRVISLEDLYIKVIKEKEKYYIQLFDENIFEEKIEIQNSENITKKELEIRLNKKVKIFR